MFTRITLLAAAIVAVALLSLSAPESSAAVGNCLGWERDMRSTAADALGVEAGRPAIDRLTNDQPFGQILNDWVGDNCMRLNYVQEVGTHNSYHIQPRTPLLLFLLGLDPRAASLQYTHRPLDQQLEGLGIRQVELDVYADPTGGRYALPLGQLVFPNTPPFDPPKPALLQPGLKVLHIPDIDFESTCLTFVICLQTLEDWSDANPGHLPIMVQVEAKDEAAPPIPPGILPPGLPPLAVPVPFGPSELNSIDTEIRSVLSEAQLITPDDVRGDRPTLNEAVLVDGWPTLNEARGQFLFTLDNTGAKRDNYVAGHPSLAGRVMFTSSPAGSAEAGFFKLNEPATDAPTISALVAAGYLDRTRADAETLEARFNDPVRRDIALASGAQFVSTDYPEPDPQIGTPYKVWIADGVNARCNPVLAPPGCDAAAFEH